MRASADYPEGAWIVELAALTHPGLVAAEAARTLGVGQARDVRDLARALASQSALLVLDNCEHVLEPVAKLCTAILEQAPAVHLLVTSQEPLRIAGEQVYRLDPLEVPAAGDADAMEGCGAVQLFVERVKAADPQFAPSPATLPAVAEICRRLDGIPLALELAAARVALLGVEGVRARLGARFAMLTGGSRLVLRRHQTLRAALDFSHGLLSEADAMVFRRLGVFGGSFAAEQAQRVCADAGMDEWAVLESLGTLVDKSLLVATGGATRRLRLLETTRAYALEKLAEAGETDGTLRRHAEAVAERMRPAYDDFWQLPRDAWVARYEPELDNLRAAIDWSCANAPELAIRLVGDSLKLLQVLALQPEALRYCEAAAAHVHDGTPARDAGRLWYAEAMICANTWSTRSQDAARRAVALLRDAGDEGVLAHALARLAGTARNVAEREHWDALAELERMQRADWKGELAWLVPNARAMVMRAAQRIDEARLAYEQVRDLAAATGNEDVTLNIETNIGEMAALQGHLDEAIELQAACARALARRRDRLFHTFALMALVNALMLKGDSAAARAPFREAMPLVLRYDVAFRYADTAALFALREGRLAAGARLLGFSDAANARHEDERAPTERAAREAALRCLSKVSPAERDAWMCEGAQGRDSELFPAALGTSHA
jgi:predicted ATPase